MKRPYFLSIMLVVFLTSFIFGLIPPTAYAATYLKQGSKDWQFIQDNLRHGWGTAIAMDSDNRDASGNLIDSVYQKYACSDRIATSYPKRTGNELYSSGGDGLSPPGASASYRADSWISQRSQGNATLPIGINAGDTDVALRINSLTFVCRTFTYPSKVSNSCGLTGKQWTQLSGWITGNVGSQHDDPIHKYGTPTNPNYSSSGSESCFEVLKRWQHVRIESLTATAVEKDPVTNAVIGTLDGDIVDDSYNAIKSNQKIIVTADNASRFWLSDYIRIRYVAKRAITHPTTVTVTMKYKQQDNYINGNTVCYINDKDTTSKPTGDNEMSWSNCVTKSTTLTFELQPQVVVNPGNNVACQAGSITGDKAVGHAQSLTGATGTFTNSWPAGGATVGVNVTRSNGTSVYSNAALGYVQNGKSLTMNSTSFTPAAADTYTAKYTVSAAGVTAASCVTSAAVGTKPYFEVDGGDVSAGKADGDSLLGGGRADVITWNANSELGNPAYDGGNTNLAVIATGSISGVVTGRGNASLPALSFASDQSSDYGGRFASMATKPSYQANIKSTGATALVGNTFTISQLNTNGVYTSDHEITVNGTVGAGKTVTLIAAPGKNIFVGDVKYAAYTLSTVPRFTAYASPDDTDAGGNIVVSSGVTALHGNYITEGTFYTCGADAATGYDFSNPVTAANAAAIAACNTKLTIYGTISAGKVLLSRTSGSYVTPAGGGAEIFKYGPEIWLGAPNSKKAFDNYVSLPPIL